MCGCVDNVWYVWIMGGCADNVWYVVIIGGCFVNVWLGRICVYRFRICGCC